MFFKQKYIHPVFSIAVVLLLFLPRTGEARDDFQYWSQYTLRAYDKNKLRTDLYGQFRMVEDWSTLGFYQISPRVKYQIDQHLELAANLTYLNSRSKDSAGQTVWTYQNRLEFEVNPHTKVKDILGIKNRNRLEFRDIEGQGSDNNRFRTRLAFSYLKTDLYSNVEFFIDLEAGEYNQNRIVPIGWRMVRQDRWNLNLFYMWQSQKSNSWSTTQILGTHLTWKFS